MEESKNRLENMSTTNLTILVKDANILIDLIRLGLLPHFFDLKYEFHITDLVLHNEFYPEQLESLAPYIDNGTLQVYKVTGEDLFQIAQIQQMHGQLSDKDCSALHLATSLSAILVTSDKQLRLTAESKGREVHGHLWVFDQMVDQGTITGKRAASKLEELCNVINNKLGLPEQECKARIKKWKKLKN